MRRREAGWKELCGFLSGKRKIGWVISWEGKVPFFFFKGMGGFRACVDADGRAQ